MLVRLFTLAILLLLCLEQAIAATTTYDYSTRTPGTDIFAYENALYGIPSNTSTPSSEFSSGEYSGIDANDGMGTVTDSAANNSFPAQRYTIVIDEDEALVSNLAFTWNGLVDNFKDKNKDTDGVLLLIWNYSLGYYQTLTYSADTDSEVTVSENISSNIGSYIGGAGNNTITLLATARSVQSGNWLVRMITDYLSVVVTSIDPPHHYEIFHDAAGKTCQSESVTIKACSDAACSSTVGYSTSMNFKVNGVTQSSPSFTGQTMVNFDHTSPGTIALSLDGFNVTPDNTFTCDDGSGGSSCNMIFDAVGCLDHFEIEHDGTGSACASESVTIKACSNADCSSLYTAATSIDFLKDGITQSSPSFTGSTTVNFNHVAAGTVALSLANPSVTPDNSTICDNTSGGSSCNMNFVTTGCIHHYEIQHDGDGSTCLAESVTIKACANADCSLLTPLSTSLNLQVDGDTVGSPTFTGSTSVSYSHVIAENVTLSIDSPSIAAANADVCDNTSGGNSCVQSFSTAGCPDCSAIFPSAFATSNNSMLAISGNPTIDDNTNGVLTTTSLATSGMPSCLDGVGEVCTQSGSNASQVNLPANASTTDITSDINFTAGEHFYRSMILAANDDITTSGGGTARVYFNSTINIDANSNINATGTPSQLVIYVDGDINIPGVGIYNAIFYATGQINISGNATINGAMSAQGGMNVSGNPSVTYFTSYIDNADFGDTCVASPTPTVHHYQIEHDGNGLTCSAEPVTIKACLDATCSFLSSNTVSLDFLGNGNTISSPTFTGSTSFTFNHTTVETLTLSVANATVNATDALVCDDGSGNSCDIAFAETGFRFLVGGAVANIPTQLSGKPSNTGYNSATLALQAIKTNSQTGACEAAIVNDVDIEFAAECTNPGACAGQKVVINGTSIDTHDDSASPPSYTNVSMDFGSSADNTADFVFNYPDAGRVQLHARYNIPVDGLPSGVYMEGSSNAFVVRPFGFYLDVKDLPALLDGDADDPLFKKAGESFEVTVKAVQWQSGDDTDNDGKPDSNAVLSTNATTTNFGNESAIETVVLTPSVSAPLVSSGVVSNNDFIGTSFESGVMTRTDVSWSEVGVMDLVAGLQDAQYIGTGNISGNLLVGRFSPDRFELVSSIDGDLQVLPGNPSFAYVGQKDGSDGAIKYLLQPEFTIKAVNVAGNETRNYTINNDSDSTQDFMKLTAADITLAPITTDATTKGVDDTLIDLDATISGSLVGDAGVNGELTFTMDSSNHFSYQHIANSRVAPFTADIDIIANSIDDGEGTSLADTNGADAGVLKLDPVGLGIRFGRWYIENSFGPETSDLPMPMYIQHWDGSQFITNSLENLTPYDGTLPANYTLDNAGLNPALNPAVVGVSGAGPLFVDGYGVLTVEKPTDGSQGQIRLTYDTAPSWLQYDWDSDGDYDNNPSAIAAFGLYRGNDRIIYWREVNN